MIAYLMISAALVVLSSTILLRSVDPRVLGFGVAIRLNGALACLALTAIGIPLLVAAIGCAYMLISASYWLHRLRRAKADQAEAGQSSDLDG